MSAQPPVQSYPAKLFHPNIPGFQVAWDATSLRYYMECPRKYFYKQVEGWRSTGEATHAEFGSGFGNAIEAFYRAIIEKQMTHDEAVREAVLVALHYTWDTVANKPKLGQFSEIWFCTGTKPYKNEKGNKAKCPLSHKGAFKVAPGPLVCGTCGAPTATERRWFANETGKDRFALLRAVVWYTEEMKGSHLKPVSIDNGDGTHTAMCEQGFALPIPTAIVEGEQIWLIGWLDSMKSFGDEVFVTDYKTTKAALSGAYFSNYRPNVQVDLYNAIAPICFDHLGVTGVGIEAIQSIDKGARFAFRLFHQTKEQAQEVAYEASHWIAQAYTCAKKDYWPRNTSACRICDFKDICGAPPDARPHMLAERFKRERWNPLKRQSEVSTNDQRHDTVQLRTDTDTGSFDGTVQQDG